MLPERSTLVTNFLRMSSQKVSERYVHLRLATQLVFTHYPPVSPRCVRDVQCYLTVSAKDPSSIEKRMVGSQDMVVIIRGTDVSNSMMSYDDILTVERYCRSNKLTINA